MSNQLFALLSAVLVALIPVVRVYIQTKFTPQRLQQLSNVAHVAVNAAEKLGALVPAGTNVNDAKLNYAADIVAAAGKRMGLKLSQDEVLAFVHDALRTIQRFEAQQVGVAPNF